MCVSENNWILVFQCSCSKEVRETHFARRLEPSTEYLWTFFLVPKNSTHAYVPYVSNRQCLSALDSKLKNTCIMATTARRTSVNGASGGFQNMDLSLLVVVSLSVWQIALAENVGWTFQGPYTYVDRGDPLEISSAGAVQDVAFSTGSAANTRSASSDAWFIGGVNSGVWRTRNFHDSVPTWENVLDKQKPAITCASIGALHVSSTNPNRIYAGCGGSTSSEQGHDWNVVNSGDWGGVMFSLDQGDTWKMVEQFPLNYYITAIYESKPGSILVAAQSNVFDKNDGGIWLIEETKDHGFSVEKVHDSPTFTIQLTQASPAQVLLATHPRNPAHSVSFSRDFGRTWSDGGTVGWKQGRQCLQKCYVLGNDRDDA